MHRARLIKNVYYNIQYCWPPINVRLMDGTINDIIIFRVSKRFKLSNDSYHVTVDGHGKINLAVPYTILGESPPPPLIGGIAIGNTYIKKKTLGISWLEV